MTDHEKAKHLILAGRVEGISADDQSWLDSHMASCRPCLAFAESIQDSITGLRTARVPVNAAVIDQTRLRVRARAMEMQRHAEQLRALWMSCVLSWVLGVVSAPLLWMSLKWLDRYLSLPQEMTYVAFPLVWMVPAAFVGAVFVWRRAQAESENGYRSHL